MIIIDYKIITDRSINQRYRQSVTDKCGLTSNDSTSSRSSTNRDVARLLALGFSLGLLKGILLGIFDGLLELATVLVVTEGASVVGSAEELGMVVGTLEGLSIRLSR